MSSHFYVEAMFPSSGLIQESLVQILGRNTFLSCYLGHLNMPNWTQVVSNCKTNLSHQTEGAKRAEGVHLQDKHLVILSYPNNYLSNSSSLKSTPKNNNFVCICTFWTTCSHIGWSLYSPLPGGSSPRFAEAFSPGLAPYPRQWTWSIALWCASS